MQIVADRGGEKKLERGLVVLSFFEEGEDFFDLQGGIGRDFGALEINFVARHDDICTDVQRRGINHRILKIIKTGLQRCFQHSPVYWRHFKQGQQLLDGLSGPLRPLKPFPQGNRQ